MKCFRSNSIRAIYLL